MLRGHPRTLTAALVGIVAYLLMSGRIVNPTRSELAWDAASLVFAVWSAVLFAQSGPKQMPAEAEAAQEGQWTIFWFTLLGVTFSLVAVFGEFDGIKDLTTHDRQLRVALMVGTLLLSWLVMQIAFTFRYAHAYYERDDDGTLLEGLDFPGDDEPDYWDFLYFSVVLGMTFQVSDVQIKRRSLRRFATAHGFLGFVFNTVILASSVNLASGLM